jgi:predicted ArsR family transcriptional regulator
VERVEDQELLQFILEHLETVPHLEAVLLIWQNQSTAWTPDVLAQRVYVAPANARAILEDLTRTGILRRTEAAVPHYLYEPAWDAERGLLPRVADLYRRQLVQVTKLIHSKGSSSVREFARAFQIKKEQ